MTSMTLYRPWTQPSLRNAMVVRQRIDWANYLNAVTLIFRPVVVTLGIATAAVMWPAHAHADVGTDAGTSALNGLGIGNNGAVSSAIAGAGQSICPMLVQPGSQLASMATQMTGHGGLAPTIAGWVATMVIQSQCPGWMTSIANGQMPAGLSAVTGLAGPALGLPSAGATSGLPFALPGAAPATPSTGLQIPGLS
ncbi:DUF732 domain-containing protein [Mycolicibacterium madagascariense]|nr:DUF732 domain-containing protein [Mycolicibacterium madagascariense]MCV7015416.1 DUF732 domain-containing protein [Mycolicibacterium madagascariense]